jgi:hypothetical protein
MLLENPNGPETKGIDHSGLEYRSSFGREPLFLERTVYPKGFWV